MGTLNKRKIINDPVYGFISTSTDLVYDVVNHPYFQRLRHIKQLGLTYLVYPGAVHTRFQHALGAMHLMRKAIEVLRSKGQSIEPDEEEAALVAILLHDVGHGPFSHALEHSLVQGVHHEQLSLWMMEELNRELDGKLDKTIQIFRGKYPKVFLNQLLSGQLDVDRLDYLKRDSFYTGVSEGVVGSDRIIKMLNVVDGELVVEAKGIYSIEKFLFARRFMYWQVYLHKTVVSAENMLLLCLLRAKELVRSGVDLPAPRALHFFLKNEPNTDSFNVPLPDEGNYSPLQFFALLDDHDVSSAIKTWMFADDVILATLSRRLVERRLYRIELSKTPFPADYLEQKQQEIKLRFQLSDSELPYYVQSDVIKNSAYSFDEPQLTILFNDGRTADMSESSELFSMHQNTGITRQYFLIYPKD